MKPTVGQTDEKTRVLWFTISGFIGTVLFYLLYEIVLGFIPSTLPSLAYYKISISWTLSNTISILWMHALHRYLVYGPVKPYFSTLIATYVAYGVSILLSHFSMMGLEYLSFGSTTSWIINLVAGGFLNYYLVSKANA